MRRRPLRMKNLKIDFFGLPKIHSSAKVGLTFVGPLDCNVLYYSEYFKYFSINMIPTLFDDLNINN